MANIESVAKDLQKPNQIVPGDRLTDLLTKDNIKARFQAVLGESANAFISSIISATHANKDLSLCDPKSIVSAAAIAAALRLPIQNNLGMAALVPYKDGNGNPIAQFQMMWRGFVQLGQRTGQYKSMNTSDVYEDEIEDWNPIRGELLLTPKEKWKFRDEEKFDKIIGYASYFKLLNGFEKFLFMTNKQLDSHGKRYSKSFNNPKGKWKSDPVPMKLKTVIKLNLSKYGPLSVDPIMQKAVTYDQATAKEIPIDFDKAIDVTYPDNPDTKEPPNSMSEAELKQIEADAKAGIGHE